MRLFFSGIAGSGVSAIAAFMHDRGHAVSGSDRAFDRNPEHPLYKLLKAKGIRIVPQDGRGIDKSLDLAVMSTAIEKDMPEVLRAKAIGIPVKTRPQYLAELISEFKTIAVAGTSGKSTASGMLTFLMQRLGLKPNFIGGGRVKQFKAGSNAGNSITGDSDRLIVEACESDGSIANYRAEHAIILNLDLDHHAIDETREMFNALIKNTYGMVILNADDGNLKGINADNAIAFSIDNPSGYKAEAVSYKPFSTDFSLRGVHFSLSLPGKCNLYNSLSAIAILSEMAVPLKEIAVFLEEFKGIERRFDVLFDDGKRLVIDDYAHNPHKISALMETVSTMRKGICYIFQPHGFTPTTMMRQGYIETFGRNLRDSDHLILLPVFYAGGAISKDISSNDLMEGIGAYGRSVEVVEDRGDVLRRLDEQQGCVVLGARDETLTDLARAIANSFQ